MAIVFWFNFVNFWKDGHTKLLERAILLFWFLKYTIKTPSQIEIGYYVFPSLS